MTEPNIEPENMTMCPFTKGCHIWIWDDEQDDWYCDECGVLNSQQEDE